MYGMLCNKKPKQNAFICKSHKPMFHSQWNIENIKCLNWDLFSHFQFGVSNRSQNSLDGANKGLEEKVVLKMVMTLKLTHMGKKNHMNVIQKLCLLRANAHLKWSETKWKWKWQWNSRTVEQATVLHEIRMGLLIPLPFLSPTSSSSSPQFSYVCRLLLKHEGMLDSGKHGPVLTFFFSFLKKKRCVATIKFKLS